MVSNTTSKAIARRTMQQTKSNQSMNQRSSFQNSNDQNESKPPLIPTKMRHLEVALALILWLGFIPTVFFIGNNALNCFLIVLVVGLMLHAYTMRPYCTEFDEEEEEAMMELVASTDPRAHPPPDALNRDSQEEWKLVFLIVTLVSTIGCCISFSTGGADVLHSWMSPIVHDCSVADLHRLEDSYHRFHCTDGFVDLSQQRSLLEIGGSLVKTYTEHRIAPVYTKKPGKHDAPVAWAIAKNIKLEEKPCGESGLCGLLQVLQANNEGSFKPLTVVARNDVVKEGAPKHFDGESIPKVIITDLDNPEGKAMYLYCGLTFYIVVLLGLCNTQKIMCLEPPSKMDANWSIMGTGYDQLQPAGSVSVIPDQEQPAME